MKETYHLNTNVTPTIPVPGDCVIKEIQLEDDHLLFIFEDDIYLRDSFSLIRPNEHTSKLTIKFHFVDDPYDIKMLVRDKRKADIYHEIWVAENRDALLNLPKTNLEYLYHNVGLDSIIVKLWSDRDVILDLTVDYVEFEWL